MLGIELVGDDLAIVLFTYRLPGWAYRATTKVWPLPEATAMPSLVVDFQTTWAKVKSQ